MKILVVGANGGIGRALLLALRERYPAAELIATWHLNQPTTASHCTWHQLDVTNELQVETLAKQFHQIDWIINAVGFLHSEVKKPEKTIREFEADFLMQNIRLNTLPTLLLAKHFMPSLKRSHNAVLATISAKVGSIADNRFPNSLFSAEQTAGYLLKRLESLDPTQSGKFYAFDGEELPW